MKELKQIAKIIKKQNLTVGEVLEEKIKDGNIDAFRKILDNFIKLNF